MTLLQTDAAINQGNSGGGLFRESDGTLIGIVNAKSSGSGIEGLGFAIPSTLAREVIGSLMDYGFVVGRPYLGVSTQDVSLSGYGFFTSAYTYPCIVSVEDGSAAQQAGLKKDDVIMAVNGDTVNRLPGNVSFCFEGIEGESLLLLLDEKGICASSGSACTSGSLDPSHVLLAIGRVHEVAHGSLRLSLSEENTDADVDYMLRAIPEVVDYLRNMSPLWRDKVSGKKEFILK